MDSDDWARGIRQIFEGKWGCKDLHQRSLVLDMINNHEGYGCTFNLEDLQVALATFKRKAKFDHYGVSMHGLECLAKLVPDVLLTLLHQIAARREGVQSLSIVGRALAKLKGTIRPTQVCAILPLPCLLGLLDALLARRVHAVVERVAQSCSPSFFECARRGRQILDMNFAL